MSKRTAAPDNKRKAISECISSYDVAREHIVRRLAVLSALVDEPIAPIQESDIVEMASRKRQLYTRLLAENHRLKVALGKARTRPAITRLTVAILEDLALDNARLKNDLIRRL